MITRRTALLAKVETVYGTDPTPTVSANSILVKNVSLKPTGDILERDFIQSSLSSLQFVRGAKWVDLSFECELKGTGVRGELPAYGWEGTLFRACGMAETVVASTRIAYAPVSTGFESATLWVYKDSIYHKINGWRGDFTITYEVGKYGVIKFEGQGFYVAPTDASPSAQTFSSVVPPVALSAGLTLDTTTYASASVEKIEFKMGNKLAQRKSMNSDSGLTEILIHGRDPGGSFDPEAVTEATYPFWSKWSAATAIALNLGPIGSTSGNIITIGAPKMQLNDLVYGDRNGILTYDVPFSLAGNAGDDELTITIT